MVTYDGDNGVNLQVFAAYCTGCHGAGEGFSTVAPINECAENGVDQSEWYTSPADAAACRTHIHEKISSATPPGGGGLMPSGGPSLSTPLITLVGNWGGQQNAAPEVGTTAITNNPNNPSDGVDNDSATLEGTVDQNGLAITSTSFYWQIGNVADPGTQLALTTPVTGTGGNDVDVAISESLSNLACRTLYSFRARSANSQGTTKGAQDTFTTDNCSDPTISFSGAGSSVGSPINVSKGLTFTNASLTSYDVDDVDYSASSLIVTVDNTATNAGSAAITNSATGAFTYTAPGAAGTDTFTLTVTDNDSRNPSDTAAGPNTATVIVYVNIVENAPQFTDGASGAPQSAFAVNEGNGSSPSYTLNLFAEDDDVADTITWSIAPGGAPSRGLLSALTSTTGTTNSITYVPNLNVDINDEFIIRVNDGTTDVDLTVTANVTAIPDNPTAGDDGPFIFDANTSVLLTVLSNDGDVDTGDSISLDPAGFAGLTTGASATVMGTQILYTPAAGDATLHSFQYRVIDTTARTSNLATVSLTPRDTDGDGDADYLDNCAGTANPDQADADGDQVINLNTTSDPGGNIGGDACDLDDDNDGMPDTFENANGLDPFDAADAEEDADGDGVSNLDEFLAGTSPGVADKVFDATGYYTPIALTPPDPQSINAAATGVRADNLGPYRPGKTPITWTAFNSNSDNLGTIVETLKINPILSFAADQVTAEGSTVTVAVSLNGEAPSYPVTVSYSVGGTAGAGDHDATNGSFEIAEPDRASSFTFDVTQDSTSEDDETVLFTFTDAGNAVIGNSDSHTVTIGEGNFIPQVELRLSQSGSNMSSAFVSEGLVTVEATVTDVNSDQTHNLDWSSTDNSLVAPTNSSTSSWTFTPVAGNFLIDVEVTDSGSPALSNRISRVLNISATAPVLAAFDSDGDGTNDDVEGFGDGDNDGVPDYLDANDSAGGEGNLIPNQTVDFTTSYLVQTEAGLTISLGNTASAANNLGVLVTDSDIEDFGSESGGKPLGATDDFEHVGGVYDFEINGLMPAAVVSVVIPLQTAIPVDAQYRKFTADKGWEAFTIDENNQIATASGELGTCPEPGSELYEAGLNYLYNCLQLTIEDGGSNDADGIANGVIKDPGTVGVELTDPTIPEVEGGGRLHPLMLFWLLSLVMFQYFSRYPLREKNH